MGPERLERSTYGLRGALPYRFGTGRRIRRDRGPSAKRLRSTSEGVRRRLHRGGRLTVIDGPLTEAKEVIGAHSILEAQSKADPIDLTRRFVKAHRTDWNVECEVR